MKWLRQKLYRWLSQAREEEIYGSNQPMPVSAGISKRNTIGTSNNKLHFSVYRAQGGHVIEFTHYDSVKDRHSESLHIITDQEDFAKELGNIVFMECLQR
jgi:hypothetical protein